MSATTASVQSWAAWKVAGGNPPRAAEISSGAMAGSSARYLPRSRSVRTELEAMAATQPWVLKRAAAIRSASKRTDSRKMSPQTGLVTSTVAVASGSSPGLWGLRKCSRIASLNKNEPRAPRRLAAMNNSRDEDAIGIMRRGVAGELIKLLLGSSQNLRLAVQSC